jgi:hypothetical protein
VERNHNAVNHPTGTFLALSPCGVPFSYLNGEWMNGQYRILHCQEPGCGKEIEDWVQKDRKYCTACQYKRIKRYQQEYYEKKKREKENQKCQQT